VVLKERFSMAGVVMRDGRPVLRLENPGWHEVLVVMDVNPGILAGLQRPIRASRYKENLKRSELWCTHSGGNVDEFMIPHMTPS
jgi:hypothetical protein